MKIEELFPNAHNEENLPRAQKKVLAFFKKFPEEVFPYATYWDREVLKEIDMRTSTIDWSIWALQQIGFLDKERVRKRTYFGFPETISRLREEKRKRQN